MAENLPGVEVVFVGPAEARVSHLDQDIVRTEGSRGGVFDNLAGLGATEDFEGNLCWGHGTQLDGIGFWMAERIVFGVRLIEQNRSILIKLTIQGNALHFIPSRISPPATWIQLNHGLT